MKRIPTKRLCLVPAGIELTELMLAGRSKFADNLEFIVPDNWPPDFLDEDALLHVLRGYEINPENLKFPLYLIVIKEEKVVAGVAGYKSAPDETGEVEIGYSVLEQYRRNGIATEAVNALVDNAFSFRNITSVTAETLPVLTASVGVLLKCGFVFEGEGSEPGAIKYRIQKEESSKEGSEGQSL